MSVASEATREGPRDRSDLARRSLLNAAWVGLSRWTIRLAHIATMVILARLLEPVEYGLVALAKVLSTAVLIGNFGLQAAVLQREEEVDEHMLDVAWTYDKLLLNAVLAACIFAAAPFIAGLYDEEGLLPVVRALALIPVVQGLENNAIIVFIRRMDHRRRAALEGINGIVMLLLVVPLAFALRSVWAFLIAYLGGLLARAVLSYVLYPRRPRFALDGDVFRLLFRYGRWGLPIKLSKTLREQLAPLVLGKTLGMSGLAQFHLGSRFSAQITVDLEQTARKVLFPVYATIQSDRERLQRGYAMALQSTWLLVLPFTATLAVLAEPTTLTLFGGEKWRAAIPIVQVMCAAGAIRTTTSTIRPLLLATGVPRLEAALNVAYALVLLPLLFLFADARGVSGAAGAVLLAEVALVPSWLVLSCRITGLRPGFYLRSLAFPAAAALVTALAAFLASRSTTVSAGALVLGGLAAIGALGASLWFGGHVLALKSAAPLWRRLTKALGRRRAR